MSKDNIILSGVIIAIVAGVIGFLVITTMNQEKLQQEAPKQPDAVSQDTKQLIKDNFMTGCDDGTNTAYCTCTGEALTKDMDKARLNKVIALQNASEAELAEFIAPYANQCNAL